jgi:hypothetical protein
MSNDLVPSTDGALVPATTGGAVGEHVGDMSVDRGGDTRSGAQQALHGDIQRAVGVALSQDQIQRAQRVLMQYRHAEDERQRVAIEAATHARWGAAKEGNLIKIHGWLDTLPKELKDEILGARDSEGTGICNKPAVLEAMLKAAQAPPAASHDKDVRSRGRSSQYYRDLARRCFEIEGWMGAPSGSSDYKKYWDDPKVQAEYREITAESESADDDATRSTADTDVERRIAEIQTLMGKPNSEYHRGQNADALQREYRELIDRRERAQQEK